MRKPMIMFVFICLSSLCLGQNNNPIGNFYLENNAVIYRNIVKDSLDSASVIIQKLMSFLPKTPNIKNIVDNGVTIIGDYDELKANLMGSAETKGNFTIDVKNGKYRVTITNLVITSPDVTITFNNQYGKKNDTEWKGSAKSSLPRWDKKFNDIFTMNATPDKKDW